MAILHSCCLWRSVRKGSYASVIYTFIYFGISCITISIFLHDERKYLKGEVDRPIGESFLEKETISATTVILNMLLLVCATLGVISSLLVIVGLRKDKRQLLLPWILIMVADILVECSHFVYLIILETLEFEPLTATLFTIDFFIMCLNVYCLVCVISQYQEYKAGRGGAEIDLFTCTGTMQYSPPTQTCMPQNKALLSPMMCPHSNCTLIPEETQINGNISGGVVLSKSPFHHKNSSLLKKHVKFSAGDKSKVCCSDVVVAGNLIRENGKTNSHMLTIETLPEYSEEIMSWNEQKIQNLNSDRLPPEK